MADLVLIDDQDRIADLLRKVLPDHRLRGPARSWAEARAALDAARGNVDVVLLDVHFDRPAEELLGLSDAPTDAELERARRRQGLLILRELRTRYPDLPVILMTGRDEVPLEHAAEVGAAEEYTYFLDDDVIDARGLAATIQRIVTARAAAPVEGPVFWGQGLAVQRLRQRLDVLARGRLPVVLLGPTGTGKSLVARHVVHPKTRRKGRFVAVDLSTTPRDLMAAQLFGSVRGAYTGAVGDRIGAFEAADGGTLFLDEIGNLSEEAQKMLLTVLQEGTVTRIGDLRERAVDVKLVVATCDDLAARVADGSFRADLYMRLNPAAAVTLPALTDRRLDLGALLQHVLRWALRRPGLRELVAEARERGGIGDGPTEIHVGPGVPAPRPGALVLLWPERSVRLLRGHDWPGNLREFAMTVENATLFALAEAAAAGAGERADVVQIRPKVVRDLLQVAGPRPVVGEGRQLAVALRPHDTLNKVAQDVERQYFRRLWLDHDGDFAAMAAVLLGSADDARKVQLRFNQLGLKVKELRGDRS
jgi:DNA-binding NtrC family response regulator